MRVLICDDNADAGATIAALLQLEGYDTMVCLDGLQCLTHARQWRPDAFILDIGMPGMNGYELVMALRRMNDFRRSLILALTGWNAIDDIARSLAAGFDGHFCKASDPEPMLEMLRRGRSPNLSPTSA